MRNSFLRRLITYLFLTVLGIFMCYPLVWIFLSSFKTNKEIFTNIAFWPSSFHWDAYINGWRGIGDMNFGKFFLNTFALVLPTVAFTILSSTIVGYGFARFNFHFKKILFALMLSTLMLPETVLIIPKYILFRKLNWLDSYLPFIVPAIFAGYPFFIFLMVQFIRGLPKELDESAKIDGCNSFAILMRILMPLCKPALFSMGIFQFIWIWNDFFNTLIYISSASKYTISLGLRMSMDVASTDWSKIMAMSILAMLPCVLIFFLAQKYFVEGIATTGIKG